MKYINKKMVLVIHRMALMLSGGIGGENDIRTGQSLAFVERIYQNELFGTPVYPDIFHQAAAYMFYILKNHTFHDGNKRTALATAITFLEWNHIKFSPFDEDTVFDFVIHVTEGPNNPDEVIPEIASWLKNMSLY